MQRAATTVDDESLSRLWNHCTWVGYINKIICYAEICNNLRLPLVTATATINCGFIYDNDSCERFDQLFDILLVESIGSCLVAAMLIKLIQVNNYLVSTTIPTDVNKVKVWLDYFKVILALPVLSFIGILSNLADTKVYDNVKIGIVIIVLIVEVYIVEKFNKAFMNRERSSP